MISGLAKGCARPPEFVERFAYPDGSDQEESVVGKMPPADDSDASG